MAGGIFGGGTGASNSPFLIEDIMDLNALRNKTTASHYYRIVKDINMGIWPYNTGEGWQPIENFGGILDGNKCKIRNMYINRPNQDYVGLFQKTTNSRISNLILENVNVVGRSYTGALTGEMSPVVTGDVLSAIKITGRVTGATYVGSVAGRLTASSASSYRNLLALTEVYGNNYASGIFGNAHGSSSSSPPYYYGLLFLGDMGKAASNSDGVMAISGYSMIYGCYYSLESGFTSTSNKGVSYLDGTNLGSYDTYFDNPNVWYFERGQDPRFIWEVFPKTEPVVFIKSNGELYSKEAELWVSVGTSITSENIARGLSWGSFSKMTWWQDFPSQEVEIIVHSQKINPMLNIFSMMESEAEDRSFSLGSLKQEIISNVSEVMMGSNESVRLETERVIENGNKKALIMSTISESLENEIPVTLEAENEYVSDVVIDGKNASILSLACEDLVGNVSESLVKDIEITRETNPANASSLIESLALSEEDLTPGIEVIGSKEDYTRFALSKDGGVTWWSYKESEWREVTESAARYEGMLSEEINALTYEDFEKFIPSKAYMHEIKMLIVSEGTSDDSRVLISNIYLEYAENQAPYFEEASIDLNVIHDDLVKLSARLVDNENDDILYKLSVKHPGGIEFFSNGEDAWRTKKSGEAISLVMKRDLFKTGTNIIRLTAKDDRGAEYYEEFNLFLDNETPSIAVVSDRYKMTVALNDKEGDKVCYRTWVNGKLVSDFGKYFYTPAEYTHRWGPSDLVKGQDNIIKIESKDAIGDISEYTFTVFGELNGIMFSDETGKYYSTEIGEVLRELDFGMVVGGTATRAVPIDVSNQTGLKLENLKIDLGANMQIDGSSLEISDKEMPFEPKGSILYDGALNPGQTRRLYARINSTKQDSRGVGDFSIKARANRTKGGDTL